MTTQADTAGGVAGDGAARELAARGLAARGLLAVLTFYRTAISPLRPPACRYVPSCSAYAVEAVQVHGAARGSVLAVRRVLRCHPFHRGGHDPVPPRVRNESVPRDGALTGVSIRPAA